jgi:hypothetical protein
MMLLWSLNDKSYKDERREFQEEATGSIKGTMLIEEIIWKGRLHRQRIFIFF